MSSSPPLSQTPSTAMSPLPLALWRVVAGWTWLLVFCGLFYTFDLPNSGSGPADRVPRMRIWEQLPILVINNIESPSPLGGDAADLALWKQSGWSKLSQRFPLWGVSLLILSGAWGWGHLFVRCLRLPLQDAAARCVLASGCGLALVSTGTLLLGLNGALSQAACISLLVTGLVLEGFTRVFTWRAEPEHGMLPQEAVPDPLAPAQRVSRRTQCLFGLALLPFALCYLGGAFLPEIDFDVKEYHFGGPKEWYLAGRIEFLAHNVYTSFPFLTEMFVLLGMVIMGDWYWGAIAGKGVLLAFAPLTALGIFAIGRRWFGVTAGLCGAFIHLSTPWIYRISIIAYAEGGLTFYLLATLLAVLVGRDFPQQRRWPFLVGVLGGSAMACKYPGLISVVLPLGLVAVLGSAWDGNDTRAQWKRRAIALIAGITLTIGPWLAKNTWETGNPVYPLAYSVFGGHDWNAESDAKWKRAHSPDHYQLSDLGTKIIDVTLKADWQSPLAFGFAPLALLWCFQRRFCWSLWGYVLYLFGTWWLLTHRLDRFWVPLIPVTSLLAGIAMGELRRPGVRWFTISVVGLAALFNWAFMTTSLCGYNAYRLDLQVAADQTAEITAPESVLLNRALPPEAKVLCVGEAELFDARFRYEYNTVFDQSLLQEICSPQIVGDKSTAWPMRPAPEIRAELQRRGITHVLVNWQEILRYRLTYGYTDFVSPQRLQELREQGVLEAPLSLTTSPPLGLPDDKQLAELRRWGPELLQQTQAGTAYQTFAVYPVSP